MIPQDDASRKAAPMYQVLFKCFSWALFQVSRHGARWNAKHNPGPITLAEKTPDEHLDALMRHAASLPAGGPEELDHRTAIAWRGLAQLEEYGKRTSCRAIQLGETLTQYLEATNPPPAPERWGVFWFNGSRSTYVAGEFFSEAQARDAVEHNKFTKSDVQAYHYKRLP